MTMILPTPVGSPISQWTLEDWVTLVRASAPAAGGVATVAFDPLDLDRQWLIDRAVVQCTSTTATQCRLYDSRTEALQLLSGTNTGGYDEADYPSGLLIRPQSALVARWTGCSNGAVATLRVQARLMRQVTS